MIYGSTGEEDEIIFQYAGKSGPDTYCVKSLTAKYSKNRIDIFLNNDNVVNSITFSQHNDVEEARELIHMLNRFIQDRERKPSKRKN